MKRNNDYFPTLSGMFDDLFNRDMFNWGQSNFSSTNTTIPAVNIKETPENFEVEMAAPGMRKENFKVQLEGNTLTISAEHQQQTNNAGNDEKYTRREFSYQAFQRTFVLPKDVVDEENIQARYENGVLKLVVPKREEAKKRGPRLINIS
ncbi:Hsp20/alpha crystallin family protein [Chitinophaga agrisoli]|nr:Hsp20/alpha crystallin family protein [Chitinophaga agrisoli]